MAKKKSFDPDALEKASKEIVNKHKLRENVPPVEVAKPVKPTTPSKKRGPKSEEKTQLCRIGLSFHRRLKMAAVQKDLTIRKYLEELIDNNVPRK